MEENHIMNDYSHQKRIIAFTTNSIIIDKLTSKETPSKGNTWLCGLLSGMNLQNSFSSLYHLTEQSFARSVSKVHTSSALAPRPAYLGTSRSVSFRAPTVQSYRRDNNINFFIITIYNKMSVTNMLTFTLLLLHFNSKFQEILF